MRAVWLLAVVALALPGATWAQFGNLPIGTRNGENEVWWTIRNMTRCLAKSKPALADAFVRAMPGSPAEAKADAALKGKGTICLSDARWVQTSNSALRGALAEGLYKARFEKAQVLPVDQLPDAETLALRTPQDMARCFAKAHATQVHALVMATQIGSIEEKLQVRQLAPGLADCLPENQTIKGDATTLRLMWILELYLADAARGG